MSPELLVLIPWESSTRYLKVRKVDPVPASFITAKGKSILYASKASGDRVHLPDLEVACLPSIDSRQSFG